MLSNAGALSGPGFKGSAALARDWAGLSPSVVFSFAGSLLPWLAIGAVAFLGGGLAIGFPADVPLGFVRTGLIHLPVAWLSILLLIVLAFWSALGVVLERPLPFMMAQALAPTGGMFAFLALWTGALWNKASLGIWWSGGAREVAEAMLLAVYLLIVVVPVLVGSVRRADRLVAVLALLGASQVPLLFFVVELLGGLAVSPPPLIKGVTLWAGGREIVALVLVAIGFWLYASCAALVRLRCIIVERESGIAESRF